MPNLKPLNKLIKEAGVSLPAGLDDDLTSIVIEGISLDSRKVNDGDLFAALPGAIEDGSHYISQALEKGAKAILCSEDIDINVPDEIVIIKSYNPRYDLAKLAAVFYDLQPGTIAAVTGTSGKTSVAVFLQQLWASQSLQAAAVGTLGIYRDGDLIKGELTTPDTIELHAMLAQLAHEGITHLIMEASSHGLHQYRLDGVKVDVAGFTNLGRDHMDYHPSEEHYFCAKSRLFTEILKKDGTAVINVQDQWGQRLVAAAHDRGVSCLSMGYSKSGVYDLNILEIKSENNSQRVMFDFKGADYEIRIPLMGRFQVENALQAALMTIAAGMPLSIFYQLEFLKNVPGRLELIGYYQDHVPIFVDYAHKPDALEQVLSTLRPMTKHRLIVVFGAGGDRDKGKRPLMGEVAQRLADIVIITDDNPRFEDASVIRKEILLSVSSAIEIPDRKKAIEHAIIMGDKGDVIVVAGKGHETGQSIQGASYPFSDAAVIKDILEGE